MKPNPIILAMTILDTFCRFLDEDDWRYRLLEDKPIIKFGLQGESADFDCWLDIDDDRDMCVMYVVAPNRVPVDKRLTVAEFLTRANYGLRLGCFEMDMDDGEVRYRTGLSVADSELSQSMCRLVIYASISTMERYYPALMSVIYGDISPALAIDQAENKTNKIQEQIKAKLESLLEALAEDVESEED